jgi:von Willebrand factor type A domain/Aerotolerance regulator N-terminal
MNFLAPTAFFFALLLPVVILFYLLKRKRVVKLVSSTLLWQKFLAETQASAPFQKLRHNWLLLLQLLLLLLAILALARPYLSAKTLGGRLQVVILDASASMQSTDQSPSRFERAKSEALKMVDSMHDTDQMVILQAAASTEVKQSATSEKAALRRALQACRVTDTPTRLQESLKLSEVLIQNQQRAEVHLFSDGAVGPLDEFENSGLPLSYHRVGQGGNNLAIITMDVRPNPENPEQRAIFASVANFSTNAQQSSLELRLDDQLVEVKPLNLGPKETSPQVFIASQTRDVSLFTARLTSKDDLAADDQASVVSVLPMPIKVLLVSAGNKFLEKALRAAAHVELIVVAALTDAAPQFDLVVLDNVTPATWPSGNVLAFHTANPAWFSGLSKLEAPPIVGVKNSHPLFRFVSLDNVQVGESLAVQIPSWGTSVIDAPQHPLAIAGELGRQRIVWIGFDVLQSTWPLRISFPIFVANAVDWLNPASINASQLTIQTGKPLRLILPQSLPSAQIKTPDGTVRSWNINPTTGELVFGDTLKQGVYRVKAGTNETIFCANLLDASESDIMPKNELKFGKYAKAAATRLRRASLELWRWIAAAGLAVLMFEWWFYHRRTV